MQQGNIDRFGICLSLFWTDVPSGMPLQGREEHESLREPCDQIEELFRDWRRKLSRRLARYYLAIALFPSPLSERSVTVSVSLRSPVVNPVAQRRPVTLNATVALRISRPTWLLIVWPPVPLYPVDGSPIRAFRDVTLTIPMGTPFPWRSPSVGNPVFRHNETFLAPRRCLTHHLHETSLVPILPARVPGTATSSWVQKGSGSKRSARGRVLPSSVIEVRAILPLPYGAELASLRLQRFGLLPLSRHAVVPSSFRNRVSRCS